MQNVIRLKLPERRPVLTGAPLRPGSCYQLAIPTAAAQQFAQSSHEEQVLQTGLLAAYQLSTDAGIVEAVDLSTQSIQGFVWDSSLVAHWLQAGLTGSAPVYTPHDNRLTLLHSGLQGPNVHLVNDQALLSITPYFEMHWHTVAFAGQLGCIQLVETSRKVQLADGETLILQDTEVSNCGPVLYLPDSKAAAVQMVGDFQPLGLERRLNFSPEISQVIPVQLHGKRVESLTVLEKYSCYFMQNAAPNDVEQQIWTPAHQAVTWGWSIRVQQRFDGDWDIFRQKLLLPTPSAELSSLPCWRSNSLSSRQPAYTENIDV